MPARARWGGIGRRGGVFSSLFSRPDDTPRYTPAKVVWSSDKSAVELLYDHRHSGYTTGGGDDEYECKRLRAEISADEQLFINNRLTESEEIEERIIEEMTEGTGYRREVQRNMTFDQKPTVWPSKK